MVFSVLANIVRHIIVVVIASCKRAACFLQRRRKNSGSVLPLHSISVTTGDTTDERNLGPSVCPVDGLQEPLESWTSWTDDGFQAQALTGGVPSATADSVETIPNYFKDMEPAIQKAAKIFLKKKDEGLQDSKSVSSRLSFRDATPVLPASTDLGTWDDSQNAWEEEDLSGEMTAAARERRKSERERRLMEHQQKKVDKELKRANATSKKDQNSVLAATKLS